jgi:hypothetical protein
MIPLLNLSHQFEAIIEKSRDEFNRPFVRLFFYSSRVISDCFRGLLTLSAANLLEPIWVTRGGVVRGDP